MVESDMAFGCNGIYSVSEKGRRRFRLGGRYYLVLIVPSQWPSFLMWFLEQCRIMFPSPLLFYFIFFKKNIIHISIYMVFFFLLFSNSPPQPNFRKNYIKGSLALETLLPIWICLNLERALTFFVIPLQTRTAWTRTWILHCMAGTNQISCVILEEKIKIKNKRKAWQREPVTH